MGNGQWNRSHAPLSAPYVCAMPSERVRFDNGETAAILTTPDTAGPFPVVLLCHGFLSSKESATNRALSQRLPALGIATLRFDFFGHGESRGPFQELTLTRCLNQTKVALSWLKAFGSPRIGLIGGSFGGLVALHTAAQCADLSVLGLKCPVFDYPPLWRERLGEAGMRGWQEEGNLSFMGPAGKARLGYAFYEDLARYDGERAAAEIRCPTRIVHGDADEYVPVSQSQRLLAGIRGEQDLVLLRGANHDFSEPFHFTRMIDLLTDWIGRWLIQNK